MKIKIETGSLAMEAELKDSPTGRAVFTALPLEASVATWGDEIYFSIPVNQELEPDARDLVSMGDLAYWPPGRAFCIFFGPTPMSGPGEIRAASAVNVIGRLLGPPVEFKSVTEGAPIVLNRA